jgi:uncharacterized protein (DUF433 family)
MIIAPRSEADSAKCGGKACIRTTRIRVADVLEPLASDAEIGEILAAFPSLEKEDFPAALRYAASRVSAPLVLPLNNADVIALAADERKTERVQDGR